MTTSHVNIIFDENIIKFKKAIDKDLLITLDYLKSDIETRQSMMRSYINDNKDYFTLVSKENRRSRGPIFNKQENFVIGLVSSSLSVKEISDHISLQSADGWNFFMKKFTIEKVPIYRPGSYCLCGKSCNYIHKCVHVNVETGETYTCEIAIDCARKHNIISEKEEKECKSSKIRENAKNKFNQQEKEKKYKEYLERNPHCSFCIAVQPQVQNLLKDNYLSCSEKIKDVPTRCTMIVDNSDNSKIPQCEECYKKELLICQAYVREHPIQIYTLQSLYEYEVSRLDLHSNHSIFIRDWDVIDVRWSFNWERKCEEHYIIRGMMKNDDLSDDNKDDRMIFIYSGSGKLRKYIRQQAKDGGFIAIDSIGITGNEIELKGYNNFVDKSGEEIKYINLSIC